MAPSLGLNTPLGLLDQERGRTVLHYYIRVRSSSTPLYEPTRRHAMLTPKTFIKLRKLSSIYVMSKTKRVACFGK
jgi:hypothetical protein